LRRSFFAVRAGLADSGIGLQRCSEPKSIKSGSSVTLANEVERSNILAPGLWFRFCGTPLLPAFTIPRLRDDWPWEVVSSYSSATAPGLHGISRADPLFQARKELPSGLTAHGGGLKHKSDAWMSDPFVMSSGNVTLHPLNSGVAAILRACPERAQRVERETSLNISVLTTSHRQK
jgi:hypothetical protein